MRAQNSRQDLPAVLQCIPDNRKSSHHGLASAAQAGHCSFCIGSPLGLSIARVRALPFVRRELPESIGPFRMQMRLFIICAARFRILAALRQRQQGWPTAGLASGSGALFYSREKYPPNRLASQLGARAWLSSMWWEKWTCAQESSLGPRHGRCHAGTAGGDGARSGAGAVSVKVGRSGRPIRPRRGPPRPCACA